MPTGIEITSFVFKIPGIVFTEMMTGERMDDGTNHPVENIKPPVTLNYRHKTWKALYIMET